MKEIIVDNFAGGGGASLGIFIGTGRHPDIAVNHDALALEMHKANHPETLHLCENVWAVKPREATKGRPVGLAWFSPDCKHFSRAKGGKPVEKRIRALAWVVVKWAKEVRPRVIILENVREFEGWGPLDKDNRPCPRRAGLTYKKWLGNLRNMGYAIQTRVLDAADYGAPTHRKRLFIIARCDGGPIVWPEPTHGDPKKLGQGGLFDGARRPWRTAAECIDWSIPCPSIFERKRPLAEKTLRRIAMGLKRYVLENPRPFIVNIERSYKDFAGQGVEAPLGTVTASPKGGKHALITPTHSPETAVEAPLPTVTSGDGAARPAGAAHALGIVAPVIARMNHGEKQWNGVDEPATTVTSQGNKHGLVTAFVKQYFGGIVGKPPTDPLPTVTAWDHNAICAATIVGVGGRSGQSPGRSPDDPLGTTTAKADRAVATAFMVQRNGEAPGQSPRAMSIEQPSGTVTPTATGHTLAAAYLTHLRGTNQGKGDVREPMPTATAGGNHVGEVRAFLMRYYSEGGQVSPVDAPMPTATTKDRIGIVTIEGVDFQIVDIGLRMLTPRELARAQGFPDSYILTGSKSNQVAKIGNSVCPPVAAAIAGANYSETRRVRETA